MILSDLTGLYSVHPSIVALSQHLGKSEKNHSLLTGLCASARSLALATLFQQTRRTMVVVAEGADEANYMQVDIARFLQAPLQTNSNGGASIAFPPQCFLFPASHRTRQHATDEAYLIQRTETLHRLEEDAQCIVVTYPDALAEDVVTCEQLSSSTISLTKGQEIAVEELQKRLEELGFVRVDFVYEPGQYAIRGGIFDIFSFSHPRPYRLDFFGDEIDSIRVFDIETQLSEEKVTNMAVVPSMQDSQISTTTLLSYLPKTTIFAANDWNIVHYQLESHDPHTSLNLKDIEKYTTLEMAQRSSISHKNITSFAFHTLPQPVFHKNFDILIADLEERLTSSYHLYFLSDSRKQIDRLSAIFEDKEKNIAFEGISSVIHEGFIDEDLRLCFYTDHQIFERFHKVAQEADIARKGKAVITLREINQLKQGDYVVHIDHGIGKFGGLVRTPINGKMQERIKITYQDNAILYVSIHSLHCISKYKGKEGGEPTLSKLGGGAWERMKERTKSKVKDIARDLIRLYAERRAEKGFAYSPDSYMQHELEASFLYEDTPDQQKATIDLKHDMEMARPMDRLICGDVGFGKTEIAMRAAFKAAADNKQTAVLVPTTVLAMQHYNTFRERLKNFPVRIEYLSRAKSAKETKEILTKLASGEIDIIIGTHKLVGKTVKFHDLGLLIIDEEQKFGVAVKEKLKQLKVNVDTLTLTATPIPRTLQFSLLGARDLSIMTTPPPNRYPVQTEIITPDDEDILREAILCEMGRNGQIFVINNLVQNLPAIRNKLHRLVPEARIAIAHGQMPTDEVEQVLTDFINYDYDILLSTSIVESGVDIPNVNTMIINSAQKFGLSDLHQLRGRVGRSNKKAYCYLIAPTSELLTPEARRRLQAIETFAELGSGFHLAMQDLDIRGAGNMLGAEQSGFIADLGYETYQRILSEAVQELRNDEFADLFHDEDNTRSESENWVNDCQLDTDLEVGFPAEYIENISERILLYRELDGLRDENALINYEKRLVDRFGTLPDQAKELLLVVRLRWLCMRLGIERIVLKCEKMILYFTSVEGTAYFKSEAFSKVLRYVTMRLERCKFCASDEKKKSLTINQVRTIQGAYNLLSKIDALEIDE